MMRSSSGNGGQSTGSNRLAGPRQQLKRPSSASSSSSSLHHHQQQPPLLRPPPPAPPPPSSSSSFPVAFFSQLYYSKSNNSYYCFCMELWRSTEYLFENRLTWLVMFGPIAVVGDITGTLGEAVCFCLSGIALIPCAERLSFVTEQVAHHTNGTIGALLNATFGNAPELLISTAALSAGFYRVVQLAMLGSMLTNMMLVFGLSCFIGGLRWQVQSLRIVSGNVNVVMLWVATAGCLFPAMLLWSKQQNPVVTVIMTSTNDNNNSSSLAEQATSTTTTTTAVVPVPTREEIVLSRVNATVMLILYLSYLIFQMGTHKEEFDDDNDNDHNTDVRDDDDHDDHRDHHAANAASTVVAHNHDHNHHVRQSARRNLVCFRWYQRARSSHWTIIPTLPSSRPRRRRQTYAGNSKNNNNIRSRQQRQQQSSIHRPSQGSSSFSVPALARRNSEEFALLRHADTIGHRSLSMEESMSQLDDIDACILSLPQTESSTITHNNTNNTNHHRSDNELRLKSDKDEEVGEECVEQQWEQQPFRSRCNSHGGEQSVESTNAADDAGWMSSSDENTTSRRRKPRRRQQQQQQQQRAKNLADSSSSFGDTQMVQQHSSTTTARDATAFVLKRKNSCGNVVAADTATMNDHHRAQSPAVAAARYGGASAAVASVASSLFLGDFAGLLLSNEKSKRSDGGANDDDDDDNNRNNSYYPRDNHHHHLAGDYDDDDDDAQQQQLIDLEAITSSSGNSSSRSCPSSTTSSPSPSPPLPASKDLVANGASPHFLSSTAATAPAAAASPSLQQPSGGAGANGGCVGSGNGGNGTAAVMSMRVGVIWLFIITLCISAMSDILVDTIDGFASRMRISQVFTSMIILPFFSNIAEQVSAFLFAYRNEMDLVVGVTVGSAIQIATFVIPGTVLIGMMMDRSMTLYFRPYETVSLFFGVICTGAILQGGTTNWLTGAMLVGIYVMFAAGVWFHEVEDLTVDAEIQIRNATSAAAAAAGGGRV